MKIIRLILATIFIVIGLTLALISKPKPAQCAWCPSYSCFGEYTCTPGCTCIIPGGSIKGYCASLN